MMRKSKFIDKYINVPFDIRNFEGLKNIDRTHSLYAMGDVLNEYDTETWMLQDISDATENCSIYEVLVIAEKYNKLLEDGCEFYDVSDGVRKCDELIYKGYCNSIIYLMDVYELWDPEPNEEEMESIFENNKIEQLV